MASFAKANHNLGWDQPAIQTLKTKCSTSSSNVGLINVAILSLLSLVPIFKSYEEQATTICAVAYHNLRDHPAGDPGCLATRIVLSKL